MTGCQGNRLEKYVCMHTLTLLHAHFSVAQFVCAHPHIFMRVTHTHGSSVCKKVFAYVSFLSISPSLSHVSPILAVPARSLQDHLPVRTVLAELACSSKRRACASPHEQREVWLSGQVRPQHSVGEARRKRPLPLTRGCFVGALLIVAEERSSETDWKWRLND